MNENNQPTPNLFFEQRPMVFKVEAVTTTPENEHLDFTPFPNVQFAHNNQQALVLVTGTFSRIGINHQSVTVWVSRASTPTDSN